MIADCRPPAHRGRQRRRISGPFAHDSRTAALAGGRPCGAAPGVRPRKYAATTVVDALAGALECPGVTPGGVFGLTEDLREAVPPWFRPRRGQSVTSTPSRCRPVVDGRPTGRALTVPSRIPSAKETGDHRRRGRPRSSATRRLGRSSSTSATGSPVPPPVASSRRGCSSRHEAPRPLLWSALVGGRTVPPPPAPPELAFRPRRRLTDCGLAHHVSPGINQLPSIACDRSCSHINRTKTRVDC